MRVRSFGTKGLFGIFDHEIDLNKVERLTIVHGPNGFGKTTLLRLLRDFFEGSFTEFGSTPLDLFYINLDDGRKLTISRSFEVLNEELTPKCKIILLEPIGTSFEYVLDIDNYESYLINELNKRAAYMQKAGQDTWEDTRDGELLDTEELVSRFNLVKKSQREGSKHPEWLTEIINSVNVKLIETQRLIQQRKPSRRIGIRHVRRNTSTVIDYASQLASKIQLRFNDYARLSQQLDRTFVVRLLKRDFEVHGESAPINSVTVKVDNLNQKRRRLRESGLLSREDEPLPSPEAPNFMIDQILNAYLQDVEHKLAVFDDLLERIELLKSIVDAHLEFKKMVISQQFGFQFRSTYDKNSRILPAHLSSGEQHIVILLYDLLFNEQVDSLILIDEPEISLHIDWQLSFLADLRKIISIVPHDILLATHSPQIINNDWHLTVALNRPEEKLA